MGSSADILNVYVVRSDLDETSALENQRRKQEPVMKAVESRSISTYPQRLNHMAPVFISREYMTELSETIG